MKKLPYRSFLSVLLLGLMMRDAALCSPLVDPFLERFRVGTYRQAQRIAMADCWPAALMKPPEMDSVWQEAAKAFFGPQTLQHDHRLLVWRFLVPALGEYGRVARWYDAHRQSLGSLLDLNAGAEPHVPAAMNLPFLLKEHYYFKAFNDYSYKRYKDAALVTAELLARRRELRLTGDEVFVWGLRLRCLQQLAGDSSVLDVEEPWPEMRDLGPYDSQSAWAVWTAHRRACGRALLPDGCGSDELARWLTGIGEESGIGRQELTRAGFAPEAESALGAAILPRGAELAVHLQRFDAAPADARYQRVWVNGRRRQARYRAAATESLAGLPGLRSELRLDLWRRASERRLLQGDWENGLQDLHRALSLLEDADSVTLRRRARLWTVQALALAVARSRQSEREALLKLIGDAVPPSERRLIEADIDAYRLLDKGEAGATADLLAGAAARVRAGKSVDIGFAKPVDLLAARQWQWDRLWDIWLQWGRQLYAGADSIAQADPRARAYAKGLAAAMQANGAAGRLALTCAEIGRFLAGSAARDEALLWLLQRDISSLAARACTGKKAAMSEIAASVPGPALQRQLLRHALLGICLAAGDSHGVLTLATSLPAAGLSDAQRLHFLYPLPPEGPLLEALQQSDIEPALLLAMARNESLFDPAARSRAGALGWLQIMPFHYPERGFSGGRRLWSDPVESLSMALGLLRQDAASFQADPYRTVAAYNAGAGAVRRWERQLGGPSASNLFLVWIGYPETGDYVENVLIDREIYDWIIGGKDDFQR